MNPMFVFKSIKALFAVISIALLAVAAYGYRKEVSSALANRTTALPRLFAKGVKLVDSLPLWMSGMRRSISDMLDDLARQGVTTRCVEPWSALVGGDGNQLRYERELNVFGQYQR